jgi:hypothetical protein
MPSELLSLWSEVEERNAKREQVRARIDDVAQSLAEARRQLGEADGKERDAAAADLAALGAEASVLPDELEQAADGYALALHHWATAGLEIAEEIERDGKAEARQAYADEEDQLRELEASEEVRRSRVRVTFAGGAGDSVSSGKRQKVSGDQVAIRIAAAARADRAQRTAQKETKPLLRMLVEGTCVDGKKASIFSAKSPRKLNRKGRPFGTLDEDGRLTGHERWLQAQREQAQRILEEAR